MMPAPLTAPTDAELAELGLEADVGEEPWVRSVSFATRAAGSLTLTWDEVSSSVLVRWSTEEVVALEISRETVDAVRVERQDGGHLVTITSASEGLVGALTVAVSPIGVQIHDTLLRT